jgi:SAM-dependent methyltransferase
MPVTDVLVSDRAAFRADVARSVRLLRAFRTEQAAPDAYYAGLARDTARQLGQYLDLTGRVVADVGGGPGYFAREFRAAGARAVCLDTDRGELAGLGRPEPGSAIGSALRLPLASGSVDVCFSANVLEHVGDWRAMLAEMVRVTRPGGIVFVAFTNWLSPWGGHETSPWHYLGGERAARRYQRRRGRPWRRPRYRERRAAGRGWRRAGRPGPSRPSRRNRRRRRAAVPRPGARRRAMTPCCPW